MFTKQLSNFFQIMQAKNLTQDFQQNWSYSQDHHLCPCRIYTALIIGFEDKMYILLDFNISPPSIVLSTKE